MPVNTIHRTSVVRSLLPEHANRLMDVGCGPITADYPYADKAKLITCLDWKLRTFGQTPPNIQFLEGDFIEIDLKQNYYDVIIAADVFEHILLEQEPQFAAKCALALKPGGHLILSVPHQGTFAFLDPYKVKPAIYRVFRQLQLYRRNHNGSCDIRKGHKHYRVRELVEIFRPLELLQVVYYGYFFDPLLTWAVALSRGSFRFPGYSWLEQACKKEFDREFGPRSFNVALKFSKRMSMNSHK